MYNNVTTINRAYLINVLSSKYSNVPCHVIKAAVKKIFLSIRAGLIDNRKIELRNFGVFSLRRRSARLVRNPKTGKVFASPEKYKVHFKTGKKLNARINSQKS